MNKILRSDEIRYQILEHFENDGRNIPTGAAAVYSIGAALLLVIIIALRAFAL